MVITLAGEEMEMLPQRALYWAAQHTLIVADIHFGKAAAFRTQGLPVPRGTTTHNLLVLEQLAQMRDIRHILFLGDFLHAKAAHAPATLAAIHEWRKRHSSLKLTLIRGNHDLHAGDPRADLGLLCVDEPHQIGPIVFCHHPDVQTDAYVLAGHVHPVYWLKSQGDSVRLPCFVFDKNCGILPSFGAFTGGYAIQPGKDKRIFVAAEETLFEVSKVKAS